MNKWIKSIGLSFLLLLVLTYSKNSLVNDQENKSTHTFCQESNIPRIIESDYRTHSPIYITNNDGFRTLDISGNGTTGNPYLITDFIFNNTDQSWLIHIMNTNIHFRISNNLLIRPLGNGSGIYLQNVTHAIISGNTIINTTIFTWQSWNNTISNNRISDYGIPIISRGIYIDDSEDTKIINNTVENHWEGIQLWGSNNNFIINNTISNSNFSAFTVYYSSYNTFSNNSICYNGLDGIDFKQADNNTIANNLILYNRRYGVYFGDETKNNTIKQNDFIPGYYPSIVNNFPAFDNGTNNLFQSNYYIDWIGQGDYNIQGFAGSEDSSPFLNPYHLTPPIIILPTDQILRDIVTIQWTQSVDYFGHSLSYTVFYSNDSGMTWIELYSGLTILTTTWNVTNIANGTIILFKIQALDSLGYKSYSISDTSFMIESHVPSTTSLPMSSSNQQYTSASSIIITPTTTSTPTTTTATSPFLEIISILMIVAILGLIHRHNKRWLH